MFLKAGFSHFDATGKDVTFFEKDRLLGFNLIKRPKNFSNMKKPVA